MAILTSGAVGSGPLVEEEEDHSPGDLARAAAQPSQGWRAIQIVCSEQAEALRATALRAFSLRLFLKPWHGFNFVIISRENHCVKIFVNLLIIEI